MTDADAVARLSTQDMSALIRAAQLGLLDATLVRHRTVCLTGTMSMPRSDVVKVVKALGARVVSGVSASCDLLVVGDMGGRGRTTKLNQAEALGVKILTEGEFAEMVSGA